MIIIFWRARYITQHYKRCTDYRERMKSAKQLSQSHRNRTSLALDFQAQLNGRVFFLPNEKAVLSGHLPWTYKSVPTEVWKALAHRESVMQQQSPISWGEALPSTQGVSAWQSSMIPWCCSSSFLHLLHTVLPDTQIQKTCPQDRGTGIPGWKVQECKKIGTYKLEQ